MLKFVNTDASNPAGKRKQSQRACESCRKRKKRCPHNESGSTETAGQEDSNANSSLLQICSPGIVPNTTPSDNQSSPSWNGPHHNPAGWVAGPQTVGEHALSMPQASPSTRESHSTREEPERRGSELLNSRFIGDLNPEGVFLAATSPETTQGDTSSDGIGVWLAKALTKKSFQTSSGTALPPSSLFHGSTSVLTKALVPALKEESLSILPPRPSVTALSNLYFAKMHPIIPLIDENRFQNLHPTDPRRVLIQQGICLAASRLFISKQYLVLPGSDTPLSYREFGSRLLAAMRIGIEMGLVVDKIVLIQALALMSHFVDGPDVGDLAAQLLGRAMQHVFSLGLHIEGHHQRDADQNGITLFCSVWALDRMNAAFHGRPVTMHERDVARDLQSCFRSQQPCFYLLLEVTLLLDRVISLYRPIHTSGSIPVEIEFPSFEELVMKRGHSNIATPFLGMFFQEPPSCM